MNMTEYYDNINMEDLEKEIEEVMRADVQSGVDMVMNQRPLEEIQEHMHGLSLKLLENYPEDVVMRLKDKMVKKVLDETWYT